MVSAGLVMLDATCTAAWRRGKKCSPHAPHRLPFAFDFTRDREHWYLQGDLADAGWPISGALRLTYRGTGRARLMSPVGFWQTSDIERIFIRGAWRTAATEAELHYELFAAEGAPRNGAVRFPIRGDGQMRTYEVSLAAARNYAGAVRQFQLAPALNAAAGDTIEIDYVGATQPSEPTR